MVFKNHKKISFKISSEASSAYILGSQGYQ